MNTNQIHIQYATSIPFFNPKNTFEFLFEQIEEKFDGMERVAILDPTSCALGIDVPPGYRIDPALAAKSYRRFKKRCEKLAECEMPECLLVFVVVLFTLTMLRNRANAKQQTSRIETVCRHRYERFCQKIVSEMAVSHLD